MHWLLFPLEDRDVLCTGERVLYRERRHWAVLVPEFAQFSAVVFLHSAISMRATTGMGTVLVVGIVISGLVLLPLLKREHWGTGRLVVVALVALWAIGSGASIEGLALLGALAMGVRALMRVIRWAFYQRTYLTDRRLMEVDGFLGVRIESMPLTMVTDVMLRRTPLGELLGYGTFRVESAGQDQALSRLDFLSHPQKFHDQVVATPIWRSS